MKSLFNRKTNIIGNIYPYKYAQETINNSVSRNQVIKDANAYASLCISYAKQAGQIIDFLDEINYLNDGLFLKLKNIIATSNSFTDTDRMKIKEKVGREIHRNRFFTDADWAMPEDRLAKLEEFYHSITFDRKEYEYHYLFLNEWDDIGLNPIPYENPDYQNKNEEIKENLRNKGINEFKENGLSLEFLLSLYESFFRIEKIFVNIFSSKVGPEVMKHYEEMRNLYYHQLVSIYKRELYVFQKWQDNKKGN